MNESKSNMEEPENTLRNMALYDFKTPINVIFYDENSDDENNAENTVTTAINVDRTDKEILIPSNVKEEKNEESEDVARSSTSPVCEKNNENGYFDECIQNEADNCNKNKNSNKITKRKRISNGLFYNDEVIKQKINVNYSKNTSEIRQDRSVISGSTSLNLLAQDLHQDSVDIMQDPLKTISNYLIIIAESYNYHISISNKKPTKNNKEISKKHYLEIKYHFFKAAYEIVHTHIIPKERDRTFMDNFLKYTIEIADKKTKLNSSKIILPLFAELIKWVKQRKRNDESKIKKPNSILIEKLSQPSVLNFNNTPSGNQQSYNSKTVTDTTKNMNKSAPTCTPELPTEEISINFDTALSNNQNNKTIINHQISRDENIRSQNLPTSQLSQYLQNCNNNRLFSKCASGTDIHTDLTPSVTHHTVQASINEIAHNQTTNKINNSSNNQNDTLTNSNISYKKNIRSQNPLPPSHLLYYLQTCNNNRRLNNVLANTDIYPNTIPLTNNDEVQHTNGMTHNQCANTINYQEITSPDTCNAYPSSLPPRHSQNNTAFYPMDPNKNRYNIQINNCTPQNMRVFMHRNTNVLPNQNLGQSFHQNQVTVNYDHTNTDIHLNINPFVPNVPHSQTTSDISSQRCYQNTVVHRMYTNQKRINDNSKPNHNIVQQITTNIISNQGLNSQYHSLPINRIRDKNGQVINDVRPAQSVHNTAHFQAQDGNCHLNNLPNGDMASIPQYLPSYVNRPISSSVIGQNNINLENRIPNSAQNQEVTVQPPPPPPPYHPPLPPYHSPIRQDRTPPPQDYVSSAIIQHNMQPEPLRSRSAVSADSGIASPVACGDSNNNMESIMNDLFELEDTSEQTTQLPIITHVTSLSSKVAFVKEGSCYICGKLAKQMCSGCYKIYYCSIDCQALDWRIHKFGCGQNSFN